MLQSHESLIQLLSMRAYVPFLDMFHMLYDFRQTALMKTSLNHNKVKGYVEAVRMDSFDDFLNSLRTLFEDPNDE